MFFGRCIECEVDDANGLPDEDGDFYCNDCWEFYDATYYRCITACCVYDMQGQRLSSSTSIKGCAERSALAKLSDADIDKPKTAVVARIRKSSNLRSTFGNSKPCMYCIAALKSHNVVRVAYSVREDTKAYSIADSAAPFVWEDVSLMTTTFQTKCGALLHDNRAPAAQVSSS